tara:strand:+ start:64 stop:630 length:567 start_codon:yes stop_codon:yes gene_type:complete
MGKIRSIAKIFFRSSFVKEESGVAAVEFSLVGLPFIFMIVGVIEMSMMFASQSLLEYGTSQGARLIRTGQVQQGGGEDAFRDAVCDAVSITVDRGFIDCDDVQYQVITLDDFSDAADEPPPEFDEDGNLEDQGFDAGEVNDIVMIRVAYRYPILTPLMGTLLTNNSDNSRIMVSTTVLQTEPYEFSDE